MQPLAEFKYDLRDNIIIDYKADYFSEQLFSIFANDILVSTVFRKAYSWWICKHVIKIGKQLEDLLDENHEMC